MSKIVHLIKREPVLLLGFLAVALQGVVEAATAEGVTTWGQLFTFVAALAGRQLVTPIAAPKLPPQ